MGQPISYEAALALATAGDPEAQYAVSSALYARGEHAESLRWLRLAARHVVSAQLALAAMLVDGGPCPRDLEAARALLLPLAPAHAKANLLLGELHGFAALTSDGRDAGLRHLLAAAKLGAPAAQRQLGLLAACHRRWELVRPLLDAAARQGDSLAAYALVRCHGEGLGGAADVGLALAILRSSAARTHHLADRLAAQLAAHGLPASTIAPPPLTIDWPALAAAVPQLAGELPLPAAEALHDAPPIRVLRGVIHPLVLDTVIGLAAPLVRRSQIVDARTGEMRADPMRSSSHITLGPRQHDHVLEAIEQCISRVSGVPARHGEFLQILRYRVGEEFRPHVDYFNESGEGAARSLADGGQRAQTVLIYLNDGYAGGGTRFPRLDIEVNGRCGDVLHFHNLGPDGLGHKLSLHAGTPVAAGEKWLLSKWIRSEPYPPRVAW